MISREQTQKLGEEFIAKVMYRSGFSILGRNIRRAQYEFDLLCSKHSTLYVIEVRTTFQSFIQFDLVYPPIKVLTLLKGINQYFPKAKLLCSVVTVRNNNLHCSFYRSDELL